MRKAPGTFALMQTAEYGDEQKNRNWHSEQPQQKITSHDIGLLDVDRGKTLPAGVSSLRAAQWNSSPFANVDVRKITT